MTEEELTQKINQGYEQAVSEATLAATAGSAHTGMSPALKAKYDALPKSEQEKLTGRWLVEHLPQVTDPALLEVLDEISAPNAKLNDDV